MVPTIAFADSGGFNTVTQRPASGAPAWQTLPSYVLRAARETA
ncbi:hypothetical protein Ais01nite_64480 [Asanoa ishikariensis]|uniref:Uncharacterized protein n=1 Tax=Asanoa ishikariensis TaxID=137265 RepID=A0A1H3NRV0_9ACTN|nr:hypothetical protein [Asanoa ishikariensis]GIF68413.1 hypothetical protein Ais01nite_64480 [Asanoa ishikariensis]SDY91564.1 hypothetical protein SAMN05421684_2275 [Asanoa ishikariensis]